MKQRYYFGNKPINDFERTSVNDNAKPLYQDIKSASTLGLYNMLGNVSELVQDNYQFPLPSQKRLFDPLIQDSNSKLRVLKGGNTTTTPDDSIAGLRRAFDTSADKGSPTVGFRLVREQIKKACL